LFEIYLDKVSLFMPFDYEKHLIISLFSVKCHLEKILTLGPLRERNSVKIEYDRN